VKHSELIVYNSMFRVWKNGVNCSEYTEQCSEDGKQCSEYIQGSGYSAVILFTGIKGSPFRDKIIRDKITGNLVGSKFKIVCPNPSSVI
jgi:hypothetical protein